MSVEETMDQYFHHLYPTQRVMWTGWLLVIAFYHIFYNFRISKTYFIFYELNYYFF